jgi:hypothetical protein
VLSKNVKIRIYKITIFACGSVWVRTWSLTLGKEPRPGVFEDIVLRRIFGPRRDEVRASWRKLHNEELRNLYSSPRIIRMIKSRRMRWAGNIARLGKNTDIRNQRKLEGKRPLGRPRRR